MTVGNANMPGFAAQMCLMIGQLQYITAAKVLKEFFEDNRGELSKIHFQPVSLDCPAFAVVTTPTAAWILVGGAWSPTLLAQTAAGYPGPITGLGGDEGTRHPLFESCATRIMTAIGLLDGLPKSNLTVAGHSLGGCVATAVAARLRVGRGDAPRTQLITYGSPRYGTRLNCLELRSCDIARYMHIADPVPLFYPHGGEWLPGNLINTVFQQSRVNRFTHTNGGLIFDNDLRIAPGHYPPMTNVGFATSMVSWLTANMIEVGNNPHSMDTYIGVLKNIDAAMEQPADRPHPAEAIPPDGELSRVSVTRLNAAVEDSLARVEREQREGLTHIPAGQQVTVVRSDTIYQVRWQGHAMALCTRKRTAQALARSINGFLRHLLVQGMLDANALTDAVASFLGAASAADSGITPKLPTTSPVNLPK